MAFSSKFMLDLIHFAHAPTTEQALDAVLTEKPTVS